MVTLVTNNIRDAGINQDAYSIVAKSVIWNFFSIAMLILAMGVTLFGLGFGKFRIGTAQAEESELTQGHIEKNESGGEC